MSYIPAEWQTGDIVTADKLNKLEEGVASGGGGGGSAFIVSVTEESGGDLWVMNKTYNEIKTAFLAGLQVLVQSPSNQYETDMYGIVSDIKIALGEETQYYIHCLKDATDMSYVSSSADGYPEYAW